MITLNSISDREDTSNREEISKPEEASNPEPISKEEAISNAEESSNAREASRVESALLSSPPRKIACRNALGVGAQSYDSQPQFLLYGGSQALKNVSLPLYTNKATAFIGPSGCGKSTLLRVLNRMYDLYPKQRAEGEVLLDGVNILRREHDLNLLRARVGMVFQKPTPFPMTIHDNIAFGIKLYHRLPKSELSDRVESALKQAALWEEVIDKLNVSGLSLSGGQQQRLCIARTVAIEPEVILLDEPCSALVPISTAKIEETIEELKRSYTIAIVTHNMQQAARVSDHTAFMYLGELIEFDTTPHIFTSPKMKQTQNYITGRFG